MAVGLGLVTKVAPTARDLAHASPAALWRRSPLPKRPASEERSSPGKREPDASASGARTAGGRADDKPDAKADDRGGDKPDEALVRECLDSRTPDGALAAEAPFRELVARYEERAYWIAKGIVHQPEDARDVAQEAFVRVFRSLDKFDPSLKFYTWFYQIVVNLAIDHLRRTKKRPKVSLDELGDTGGEIAGPSVQPGEAVERDEAKSRVARVLLELPDKYRSIIVLRDLEGFDGKEVATIAGATHATVRWRLHKARQMFRAAWERIYGAQP